MDMNKTCFKVIGVDQSSYVLEKKDSPYSPCPSKTQNREAPSSPPREFTTT